MSKCHVRELQQVYRALFADALCAYPTLGAEFEKDLARLQKLVERRGLRVYLADLPAVGKHFDKCLALGQYILSGLPLTKRFSGRVVIPKFLRGLYLLVFHETGRLREDCDIEAVFFIRQLCYAAKKMRFDCSQEKVEDSVLDFFETDAELPEPEGFWNAQSDHDLTSHEIYEGFRRSSLIRDRVPLLEDPHRIDQATLFLGALDKVSSVLATILGSYDPTEWRFRHGPGAVAEVTGPSNKYSWKNWSDTLEVEYPIADYGYHSYSSWADSCNQTLGVDSKEPSSRLVAVPKSFSGPRLIAAEPAEHQWCQQNVWHFLCSRASSTGIRLFVRFTDQSRNQELCSKGSREGTLATVDLSSASDRVTCHVVGQFFRRNPGLLRALRASRTRSVVQKLTPRVPETIRLRKFSTMGSACTFPIQSLIFLGIALASVLTTRKQKVTLTNIIGLMDEVAVFGDDIIVPVDSRELFTDALKVLYFKINPDKSFWTGRFRESCGRDAFMGVDVTPVYWRTVCDGKPESVASNVVCSNNYYEKWLMNTSAYLASTLPKGFPMVAADSGVLGLKSRCGLRNDGLRRRYNRNLHQDELLVLTMISSQRKTPTDDDTALLQYFTERPDPLNQWTHGIAQRPNLRMKARWVPIHQVDAQST